VHHAHPVRRLLGFAKLDTPFVAVLDPQRDSNIDAHARLSKTLPALHRRGMTGYRVVYQNATWRLFAQSVSTQVSKD
jgi:hypothetical protein